MLEVSIMAVKETNRLTRNQSNEQIDVTPDSKTQA